MIEIRKIISTTSVFHKDNLRFGIDFYWRGSEKFVTLDVTKGKHRAVHAKEHGSMRFEVSGTDHY